MILDRAACDRARKSRDARFDGRFFIAVTSTRIYCRPICPARSPKDCNVRYYSSAAAAEAAGFRPCLRCRPEASPGTPRWSGTASVVSRALRLIAGGALDHESVDQFADRLGVTSRHLRRLFVQHLGATPVEVALTRRVQSAKRLLDDTRLPLAQVAVAAGFGSVRRFNGEMRRTYSRTPTQLRQLARRPTEEAGCYRFHLSYRPPYNWNAMIGFLAARAVPGVEQIEPSCYRRAISVGKNTGSIAVSPVPGAHALALEVRFPDPHALLVIVERVKRMFDVAADPAIIAAQLSRDRLLRRACVAHEGIRVPGAWDPFEVAVRAILGQQVSVRAATTLAARVATRWGVSPASLAEAPIEEAGIIRSRANTIRTLAREVRDGRITFDGPAAVEQLRSIPGIGDWTAQYVAIRALNEPDAFPSSDLVLRRMAGDCSTRELQAHSERWRPWRAYAVMLLWQSAIDGRQLSGESAVGSPHARRQSTVNGGGHATSSTRRQSASRDRGALAR
jgi:AraC family transcriptional regulator of adaptative response / DNA-3-methyladenine glycosylase II